MGFSQNDRELLRGMLGPAGEEVGCDECFDYLNQYVERKLAGEDMALVMPRIEQHLVGCPVCHDEEQSLLELLERDREDDLI